MRFNKDYYYYHYYYCVNNFIVGTIKLGSH